MKNGAVSLSPRNLKNAWGKDTKLRNYLEDQWGTVAPKQNSRTIVAQITSRQAAWSQKHWSGTSVMAASIKQHLQSRGEVMDRSCRFDWYTADRQAWTRWWSNRHCSVQEIKHHDRLFWPDCSSWTKIQPKRCLQTKRWKPFQHGWSAIDSTEDNPGCSSAKMNPLKMLSKTSIASRD